MRVFWALLGIALAGLAVGGIGGIASGGYRSTSYANGFDPVRVGMLVFLVAATAAFAVLSGGGIVAWRAGHGQIDRAFLVFVIGMTIATAAMIPIFDILPAEPGHSPVPMFLLPPLYLGFGLSILGFLWSMVPALREAVRRRDPLPFLGLVMLAGLFILLRSRS